MAVIPSPRDPLDRRPSIFSEDTTYPDNRPTTYYQDRAAIWSFALAFVVLLAVIYGAFSIYVQANTSPGPSEATSAPQSEPRNP